MKAGGLVIGPDVFFNTRGEQLGALASRHGVAAIYQYRPFALAGGLMSYSGDIAESHRLAGGYTGQMAIAVRSERSVSPLDGSTIT